MRRGHRPCVFIGQAPAYRKQSQGCIRMVPVDSAEGAFCIEMVCFLFRINKSLGLRAAQLQRTTLHEKLVRQVIAGYGSQEEMFGDTVKQGIKVKRQNYCAFHDHAKI